ncbi:hypothetical protein Tco_1468978 [Tanacetum coccineum]
MAAAAMSVVHVLTTPIPEDGGDDPTVEQVRKRNKRDNDDYVCRGLILKGMCNTPKMGRNRNDVPGRYFIIPLHKT